MGQGDADLAAWQKVGDVWARVSIEVDRKVGKGAGVANEIVKIEVLENRG